jgi:catechol 2,3-dioxygenase-like lactoylglutathione lyase family enzyme
MLGSSAVMAFVATRNPARAREFYGETLGLGLVSDDPYALVFDAHGTTLRVQKVNVLYPPSHTVLGFLVSNIEGIVDGLAARGVVFERYPGMPQDERGLWATPDGSKVAWFKDPDGNTLSLTELAS